jgi:hypothetical protein
LLGGLAGLGVLEALDWKRLACFRGVGLICGIVLGASWFLGGGAGAFLKAALVFGTMGLAAASVYWRLRHPAA